MNSGRDQSWSRVDFRFRCKSSEPEPSSERSEYAVTSDQTEIDVLSLDDFPNAPEVVEDGETYQEKAV